MLWSSRNKTSRLLTGFTKGYYITLLVVEAVPEARVEEGVEPDEAGNGAEGHGRLYATRTFSV